VNRFFLEMIWRPWAAMAAAAKIMCESMPTPMKIDAILSHTAHTLSSPFAAQVVAGKSIKTPSAGMRFQNAGSPENR